MTWQDVADLSDYWKDHPPVQWMVQGYLGIKPEQKQLTPEEIRAQFMAKMA